VSAPATREAIMSRVTCLHGMDGQVADTRDRCAHIHATGAEEQRISPSRQFRLHSHALYSCVHIGPTSNPERPLPEFFNRLRVKPARAGRLSRFQESGGSVC
jgi:hypothetical protein